VLAKEDDFAGRREEQAAARLGHLAIDWHATRESRQDS